MLNKELDKLRDKTLSFGCVIFEKSWWEVNYHRITTVKKQDNWEYTCECWWYEIFDISDYNIIWHPLTLWRIEHYYRNNYPINKPVHKYITVHTQIYRWFESNRETAYNQSELERMQSPHREELKKLLLQFSNYL